ncbi:MAG: nicotinamide-nucleotide amidohydrolase family protein [Sphaerochaeta sp.]|jgi:nicotinamide-nucleotide amidase|nr:nicotinamide-nucleotide amidohydrolase family protein [Sphaerochaeta sp.]
MNYSTAGLFIIGTELTRGVIADKHCQLLAHQLTRLGYHVERMVVVPDDGSIETVLRQAIGRCDLIILTGGLGPTSDDLTRSVVARLAGVELKRDKESFDTLYGRIGERIWGANEQQTLIPDGFVAIPNPNGTAAGFRGIIDIEGREVALIALPGPPREMDPMFFDEVLPYLARLAGHNDFNRSEYSTFLIPEAKLEELCRQASFNGLEWGTRFQEMAISLYLVGGSSAERDEMANRLRAMVGPCLIADGEVTAATLLTRRLCDRNETISCAESCTGGMASVQLTDQSGSSQWFWGSAVSYANEAKTALLGVREETITVHGAVSQACAIEMAEGIRHVSGTDWAFSITGIAGPDGGSAEKPVGTVCFGFAGAGREAEAVTVNLSSYGRSSVRRKATTVALLLACQYIEGGHLLDTVSKWQYI